MDLNERFSKLKDRMGASYGCFYCGRKVPEAVHLANTAYCCRECFVKYDPKPMAEEG